MRRLLLALVLLALPALAAAQTQLPFPLPSTCKIQWDHSGANVTSWQVRIDGQLVTTVAPAQSGTTWTVTPCPSITAGNHTMTVSACNVGGCTASAPYSFTLVVSPNGVTNLRMTVGVDQN